MDCPHPPPVPGELTVPMPTPYRGYIRRAAVGPDLLLAHTRVSHLRYRLAYSEQWVATSTTGLLPSGRRRAVTAQPLSITTHRI